MVKSINALPLDILCKLCVILCMEELFYLKKSGNIYYRCEGNSYLCVYHYEDGKYYAECGKDDQIVLYGLDDGTFTKTRLIMSNRMKFKYSNRLSSYQVSPKGTVTIKGHYPFFIACEKRKKPIPVYLDIDGKFYRKPVHNFKERLKNKKSVPRPKKYVYPVLDGKFNCLQCRQPIENVKRSHRQFCSIKCAQLHLRLRGSNEEYFAPDYRTNRDREEDGLINPGKYYVCVVKTSRGGRNRVDWLSGPYESETDATNASGGFLVQYEKDHGWSDGYACEIRRLNIERLTIYGTLRNV